MALNNTTEFRVEALIRRTPGMKKFIKGEVRTAFVLGTLLGIVVGASLYSLV